MPLARAVFTLLAIAIALCGVVYLVTGRAQYLRWAALLLKIVGVAALLFFVVLLLERLV